MMRKISPSEALSRSKAVDILLSLLEGPKHIRLLHREVGGSTSTIESRVRELIRAGLIKEAEGSTPARKILELTDSGRIISMIISRVMGSTSKVRLAGGLLEGPRRWILLLLYVLGEVKGSTRLEKLLFLLKEEFKVVGEDFYHFTPYLFGPFSPEALNDARLLRDAGLIEIKEETFDIPLLSDWIIIRKSYRLTRAGMEVAKRLFEDLKERAELREVFRKLQHYNTQPLNVLLNYIYEKYPEYRKEEILV